MRYTKAKRSTARSTRTLTADHVILAAASLGTQKLLHRMKEEGHLPALSERLVTSALNSESILGAIAPSLDPTDYTEGVGTTPNFSTDEHTPLVAGHGKGHNAMAFLQTVLTDGDF